MTARAKVRKDIQQLTRFVKAFDAMVNAARMQKLMPGETTQRRFEEARSATVAARDAIGELE